LRRSGRFVGRRGPARALRAAWGDLTFEDRRTVVEALVAKVVVGPATRARWTTIAERLDPEEGYGIVWRA
jgi:hypothetical protein